MTWNLQRGTRYFDSSFTSSYWGIYWPYIYVYVHFYIESESSNLLWIKHIFKHPKGGSNMIFISTVSRCLFFHASQICPRPGRAKVDSVHGQKPGCIEAGWCAGNQAVSRAWMWSFLVQGVCDLSTDSQTFGAFFASLLVCDDYTTLWFLDWWAWADLCGWMTSMYCPKHA